MGPDGFRGAKRDCTLECVVDTCGRRICLRNFRSFNFSKYLDTFFEKHIHYFSIPKYCRHLKGYKQMLNNDGPLLKSDVARVRHRLTDIARQLRALRETRLNLSTEDYLRTRVQLAGQLYIFEDFC
uniref:HSF_DOMAIN domain-containing protein n=1 Tax=Angiostrongylus cantonensis TaxID=6313 RepID=A0A0K0DGG4_ANGCA